LKTISIDHFHYSFDKNNKPVLSIKPGEEVCFEVMDACMGELKDEESFLERRGSGRPSGPVCGPVYLEGAEPGDMLVAEIIDVKLFSGFQLIGPHRAIIDDEIAEWSFYHVKAEDGLIYLANGIKMKADPVIGTFGNAPAGEASALAFECGGNYDVPFAGIGSRLFIPVEVAGALFSAGDVHALQGDGEIAGSPEMKASIQIRFDLIKADPLNFGHIRIERDGHIHSPAFGDTEYIAIKEAVMNNAEFISRKYKLLLKDSLVLLTMLGKISISRTGKWGANKPIACSSFHADTVRAAAEGYRLSA
jgi:amidase